MRLAEPHARYADLTPSAAREPRTRTHLWACYGGCSLRDGGGGGARGAGGRGGAEGAEERRRGVVGRMVGCCGAYLPSWGAASYSYTAPEQAVRMRGRRRRLRPKPMAVDQEGASSSSTFSFGFGGEEEGVASAPPITPAPATNPSAISAPATSPSAACLAPALLLSLSLACGTSSKRQCATLSQHIGEVLSALVAVATQVPRPTRPAAAFSAAAAFTAAAVSATRCQSPLKATAFARWRFRRSRRSLPTTRSASRTATARLCSCRSPPRASARRLELRVPRPADPPRCPRPGAFGASYFRPQRHRGLVRPRLVHACVPPPFECPEPDPRPLPEEPHSHQRSGHAPRPQLVAARATPPPPTTPPPLLPAAAAFHRGARHLRRSSRASRWSRWSATAPTFSPT